MVYQAVQLIYRYTVTRDNEKHIERDMLCTLRRYIDSHTVARVRTFGEIFVSD